MPGTVCSFLQVLTTNSTFMRLNVINEALKATTTEDHSVIVAFLLCTFLQIFN